MTESLCCTAEIDRTLEVNYNQKDKNLKKKSATSRFKYG